MLHSTQTLPSRGQRNSELSVSTLGLLTNAMNICEKVQNVSFSARLRGELQGHIMTASIILSTMVFHHFLLSWDLDSSTLTTVRIADRHSAWDRGI